MSTIKERAMEIYKEHLHLAASDGRLFRKTVMDQLMLEFNATLASVATHYNTCKKTNPIEGLGRAPVAKGLRKPGGKGKQQEQLQDDNDCFSVLEIVNGEVGRCQSFLIQGDASECFDLKIETWPNSTWVLIRGLGPVHGETYKLEEGELEIKRFPLPKQKVNVEPVQA